MSKSAQEPKKPDFIILEDDAIEVEEANHASRYACLERLRTKQFSLGMRLLYAFGSLLAIAFIPIFAVCASIGCVISVLFSRSSFAKKTTSVYAQGLQKCCVFAAGLAIAVASPRLGISLIILHFLFKGKPLSSQFFAEFVNRRFN